MTQILVIGKRRWAAGLTWRTFEDRPRHADLQDMGDEVEARWYTVRTGESALQAGFCSDPEEGKAKGASALAAAVADIRPQPWLGIFRINEHLWWYLAVRDGNAILPDGDVIGSEQEILAARERHSGFDDWEYLQGGIEELADLLEQSRRIKGFRPAVLRTLYPPSPWPYAAAALAVALGAGGVWLHHRSAVLAQAEREQALAMARREQEAAISRQAPWRREPAPSVFLGACVQSIGQLPIAVSGWRFEGASCRFAGGGLAIDVAWRRASPLATAAHRPAGMLSANGEMIFQPRSVALPAVSSPARTLLPVNEARDRFWAVAQAGALDAHLSSAAASGPVLPGAGTATPKMASTLKIRAEFTADPAILGAAFDALPGARFTALRFRPGKGAAWEALGVLHTAPEPQPLRPQGHPATSNASPP